MSQTVRPPEERQRPPQDSAARRNKSTRPIIKGSVDCCGVDTTESAAALVAAAGERAGLSGDDAIALAVDETRAERGR